MSTVSENIRYLRKLKGYTQEQFAERIGIKRSLLGAYEEARANPNEIYLDSMAEVLGVSVEHLLNEDLRERGRRLGAGTILKLNKTLPDHPAEEDESSPVQSASNGSSNESFESKGQMDLFSSTRKKVDNEFLSDKSASEKTVGSYIDEEGDDFIGVLRARLADQPAIQLFTPMDDLPVSGLYLVGKRLSSLEDVKNDTLYIFVKSDGEMLFRRAFNQLSIKGTLILSSDFPDKPTVELRPSELAGAFRYLASIRTDAPSAMAPARELKELASQMMHLLERS